MSTQKKTTGSRVELCLAICIAVLMLINGCNSAAPTRKPSGSLVRINFTSCDKKAGVSSESFSFKMISSNRLAINHAGAEFNCCIDGLAADVVYSKSQIVIYELEIYKDISAMCLCTCGYNIDYGIPVVYGNYDVIIKTGRDGCMREAVFKLKLDRNTDESRSIDHRS